MYMTATTIDDLLQRVLTALLRQKRVVKTSRGESLELNGVLLRLRQPRARLSRSEGRGRPFSALGELLWYLAGSNSLRFIEYYVPAYARETDDGKTLHGAYGPRLFNARGQDQIENVVTLLRKRPTSRRAVIQLFDAADLAGSHKEVPCTCTLQFMLRGRRLHMLASMRSNDAHLGLPHDIFAFTMLQELLARTLGVEPGYYDHAVGSLHLYLHDQSKARQYLEEGWQSTVPMPPMPPGEPWRAIALVLRAESRIRRGLKVDVAGLKLAAYWADLLRLLQAFRVFRDRSSNPAKAAEQIARVRQRMVSRVYDAYLERKQDDAASLPPTPGLTLDLFPEGVP